MGLTASKTLKRPSQPLVDRESVHSPACDIVAKAEASLDTIESLRQELVQEQRHDFCPPGLDFPPGFLLSVVIPVFNEQRTICRIVGSVLSLPIPLEIIAVDDGSTDGSRHVLEQLSEQHPRLQVILQPRNGGKGSALRRGFASARGSHVLVQDADLEYNPREIPGLIKPLIDGEADVVYGSRFLQRRWSGSSWVHRLGNWVLTQICNRVTGLRLTDMETCYKAFRRDLLDDFQLEQDGFGIEVELTAKLAQAGARFSERPISYEARNWEQGKKIGWRDAVHALRCMRRYGRRSLSSLKLGAFERC